LGDGRRQRCETEHDGEQQQGSTEMHCGDGRER
jgi:hypothetical protein